jgi:hypothetical protein
VRGGFGGCPTVEHGNRLVKRRGAIFYGYSHGADQRIYQLLVAGEVESVRPLAEGDWKIQISPPWMPQAPGARALRLLVATDDRHIDETDRFSGLFPKLELTYSDGRTRIARGP